LQQPYLCSRSSDSIGSSAIRALGRDGSLLSSVWIERLIRIITHSFDNTKPLCPALSKQYPITDCEKLWPLHKAECHGSSIASANIRSINIDNCARLRDGAHVKHSLILCLDGGRVAENEHFGNEFAVHFWRHVVVFEKADHALANVLSAHLFQGEAGALACAARGHGYPFALNASDARCCKVAEAVRADYYCIASVNNARLDNS
jgi:hypothetical protein